MELVDDRIVCCDLKYSKEERKRYKGMWNTEERYFLYSWEQTERLKLVYGIINVNWLHYVGASQNTDTHTVRSMQHKYRDHRLCWQYKGIHSIHVLAFVLFWVTLLSSWAWLIILDTLFRSQVNSYTSLHMLSLEGFKLFKIGLFIYDVQERRGHYVLIYSHPLLPNRLH